MHVQRFRNIPGKLGDLFDILPNTYTLPGDYVQFCTEFAKRHEVDAVGVVCCCCVAQALGFRL